jgi:peroxiredoxin Q/BCP
MLTSGSPCPAFRAIDCDGNTVSDSDLLGHRFVLWFYPKADTPG